MVIHLNNLNWDETSESPPESAKKNMKTKRLKLPSQKAITPILFPG